MIEKISGEFSREIAKAFGETQDRSISRILGDNLGISVNSVHVLMGLGLVAYFGSRNN